MSAIRLQYEQTLTACSRRLLASHYDEDPLTDVLTCLLKATSISRIGLFKNFTGAKRGLTSPLEGEGRGEGGLCTLCTHQVVSSSLSPDEEGRGERNNQYWFYQQGLIRWQSQLSQGQIISGNVADFPPSEQDILQALECLSLLVIPLEVAGQWYGFVCFGDIVAPRQWKADEIYLLKTATELIGIFLTRRQNESHWREHETRYHSVVAAMQEGVVLQYADGRVGACNASAQRILGISAEQLIGMTSINPEWRLIYEEGTPFPEDELPSQVTLRTGQPCSNVVLGVQRPDDHIVLLSINSQPLWHEGDKLPSAVVSTFSDITARKQMEDALALSEKRFRAIFNSAAVAITLVNPEGHYIQFNARWLDMLGYTAEEMRLKKNIDLYHYDDYFAIEILMQDLKRGDIDHFRTEIRLIHKNGKVLWGDISCSALRNRSLEAIINIVMDITDRKPIEEERDRLFNLSVDMQCIICFDGYFQQLNSAWEHTLGYRRKHLLTQPFLAFVHPDDWNATHRFFEKLLEGESVQGFENRYRSQDNAYRWFSWNAYPLVEQRIIYAIIRDITESKQNEVALKEAHERLLTILDSLESLVYVADMQTYELLYVNKYGQKTFGSFNNGQLCWKTWHKEQNQPCSTCSNEKLLTDIGEPTGVYTSEVQEKKTGKWYLTHDRAIRWVDGRNVRLQIATDITKHKHTEEALKINEHRYRTIVQGQTELICRYLPDGRLSFVNEAYCRYFNTTEAELIGHYFTALIFDEMQDVITQMMESLSWKTPVTEMEHRSVLNSEERWQHWIGRAMFDENEKLVEYQVVGRDITERKQALEELRRAKEAAEAATRAKSEFLANMSHEIRTPMNGVVGMTELLLNTELTPKQREYAEIIYQSTEALQTIINDVLDFSKIEAGKLSLEGTVFDLEEAVLEVARLLSLTAESKGFELIVRYAPDAPRHFVGDAGRIRQILTNLVGNAIKFTHDGYVMIDVDCQIQTFESVCRVFHIKDTGIGIPPDKLHTLFDKFTQADTSTTRQFGGTGLGLAISQQLVKMMNGEMGVVSEWGKGSTFTFTLPLPLAEIHDEYRIRSSGLQAFRRSDVPTFLATPELQSLQGTRVLIVDDNPVNQRILIEQLESLQIRCEAVDSGQAALTAMRVAQQQQDPYWLALLDYFMPVMDGEQLGKLIKQDSEIKETILVMLSSAGYQQDSHQLQQVGFSAHLVKPLPQYQLQQALLYLKISLKPIRSQDYPSRLHEFVTMEKVNKFQFKRHQNRYPNTPVLLVEDNEVNRMVAVNMLEQLGCQVTEAKNGLQALEILDQHKFSIIFMDIQMPEMDGFEATQLIREHEAQPSQTQPPKNVIVAMTANAMPGDAQRCLAAGMDDYIAKPISLERIFDIIKKYCPSYQTNLIQLPSLDFKQPTPLSSPTENSGITTKTPHGSSIPALLPPSSREDVFKEVEKGKQKENKKILLVEDNPLSRLVATNLLEALGCTVEVVENGKQAVDICTYNHYDIILMDILMPVMDGVEATKLIRQGNVKDIPIVAVTANYRPTDLKRYIAAGMNDCVGKPVTVERISEVVEKYTTPTTSKQNTQVMNERKSDKNLPNPPLEKGGIGSSPQKAEKLSSQPNSEEKLTGESTLSADLPIFDTQQAKRIAIGKLRILLKIIDKFTQDTPKQLEKLQTALQEGNHKNAERLAHSLKGSARSVGALRLGEMAFTAETAAKQGDLAKIEQLLDTLTNEFTQLQALWEKTDWETLL